MASKSSAAATRVANLDRMLALESYDYVIVCTGDPAQARFWQARLAGMAGQVFGAATRVLAVDESQWNGGAGNGFGTLFAFENACTLAAQLYDGVDLAAAMRGGASVALYHTAGKGTRLAPLPGAESNNKPGVALPAVLATPDGGRTNMSILESVIKQTGVYAGSRGGRLSVYWGDQIFIPSTDASYAPTHEVDIMCTLRAMPSAEEWAAEGLDKYGLIAVNAQGNAAQVEKVSHATATALLSDGLGEVVSVGTSLGSFSVSEAFLSAMMAEYAAELAAREGSRDTDPHFWMPLTLSRESYLSVMAQKGVDATVAATNYDRMAGFNERFRASRGGDDVRMFGAVDVGRESYWWDYGQLKLYFANNKLATATTDEAASLRRFLGLADGERTALSDLGAATVDGESCVIGCTAKTGSVARSCLSNVGAQHLEAEDSLLVNVSAKRISARGALLYNVVDESEEGLTLGPGEARADVLLNGERVVLLCDIQHDGRVSWKANLEANSMTFEEVWKANKTQDCVAAIQAAAAAHAAARAKF